MERGQAEISMEILCCRYDVLDRGAISLVKGTITPIIWVGFPFANNQCNLRAINILSNKYNIKE
ncbi:MAG: hypothetical protein ACTSR5_00170 [Promethearchaeota archaeon]